MHQILPSTVPESGNFAELVLRHSHKQPYVTALNIPLQVENSEIIKFEEVSFGELGLRVERLRTLLRKEGLKKQDRVVVMFKPCVNLYAMVIGLLAEGMVPVFIDTGMGRKKMLGALQESNAKLIVAASTLLRLRWLLPAFWGKKCISADKPILGVDALEATIETYLMPSGTFSPSVLINESERGLISFTSGSTGRPKGADRTHDSLIQQHMAIRDHWQDSPDDIDMTSLPVVVLHNLCCGMPSVLPAIDFSAPGNTDGHLVIQQIKQCNVTRISGAPAFVERLADAAILVQTEKETPLPLKSISLGGAPVTAKLARKLKQSFPEVLSQVVYGSTEAEPIASVDITDVITEQKQGYLVGVPAHQSQVLIVKLPESIDQIKDDSLVSYSCDEGNIGELVVKGKHVLKGYVDNPEATRENKIKCDDGTVWHRTGDLARIDDHGRIWLMGRQSDSIQYQGQSILTYPLESKVDAIKGVRRSALVQSAPVNNPVLVFESELDESSDRANEYAELEVKHLIMKLLISEKLSGINITCVDKIPVDSRHNSKIERSKLRKML